MCSLALGVRSHSTIGVAFSQALFFSESLWKRFIWGQDGPLHTLVNFYNLYMDLIPGSQVPSVWTIVIFMFSNGGSSSMLLW